MIDKSFVFSESYIVPIYPSHPISLFQVPNLCPNTVISFVYTILSAGIDDIPPCNLLLAHQIVDALQLAQSHHFVWSIDQAPLEELQGLGSIAAIAHVRALDGDHLDDGLEDGRAQKGASWQANGHNRASGADIFCSLLEGLLADSNAQDGVGSKAVIRAGLHVSDEVLGCLEVDVVLCSELLDHGCLLSPAIDGNDLESHGCGVLTSQAAEPASSSDDGYGLTWTRS